MKIPALMAVFPPTGADARRAAGCRPRPSPPLPALEKVVPDAQMVEHPSDALVNDIGDDFGLVIEGRHRRMDDGADILDVGGESTRRGPSTVSNSLMLALNDDWVTRHASARG